MCLGDGGALASQLLLVLWSTCGASAPHRLFGSPVGGRERESKAAGGGLEAVATGTPVKKLAASCSGCDQASVGKGRPL